MRLQYLPVLLLALFLLACDVNQEPKPQPTEEKKEKVSSQPSVAIDGRWREHVESWPRNAVSAQGPLELQFTHPVVAEEAVDESLEGLLRVAPEQAFEATFIARDRLQVRFQEPLESGQRLKLTLFPQSLVGVDDSLPPLQLPLRVLRQHFSLRVDALAPAEKKPKRMRLDGELTTTDQADPLAVQSVLTATQDDRALEIEWHHNAAGLGHGFSVLGIHREDQPAPVLLHWDGAPLKVDNAGERRYPVPKEGAFQVTAARAVSYPQPHIVVQFSQPLMGSQDISGLVTLDDEEAEARIDGSRLRVYPKDHGDDSEPVTLMVNAGLRSTSRTRLEQPFEQDLLLSVSKPGVRFIGDGVILPAGETLSVPFEAVGTGSVKVQAFEVFADNIAGYLQNNDLSADYADTRHGRYLWQKTLSLPPTSDDDWQRYRLDLSDLMAQHPNGLVRLTLKIDADTIDYRCQDESPSLTVSLPDNYEGPGQDDSSHRLQRYYDDAGYLSWQERNNPCADAYYQYNDRAESSRAFLASNLGLMAKQGEDHQLTVIATHLDVNQPAPGVRVRVHNYQHQRLAEGTTDGEGEVTLSLDGTPFYLVADDGGDQGYLKLARNQALPTNQFDTGGERVRDGLKGFFYGERDVWRPGDDIHLSFILSDPDDRIPDDHPVTLDWFDPQGNRVAEYSNSDPVGAFYTFTLETTEDAPTGNWRAVARVGERYFDTPLRIEAIKPNRLKIELEAPDRMQSDADNPVVLRSQWLNGVRANQLKADVAVRFSNAASAFEDYAGFAFDDPTRELGAESFTAFEGTLDAQGERRFSLQLPAMTPPGMARATLTTRVFENSGDYSTRISRLPVQPYQHWVGMRVPEGDGWGGALGRDQDHEIGFLTLDDQGEPEADRELTLSLYRIDWRWWWDQGDNQLTHFISNPHTEKLHQASLTSDASGRAQWTLSGDDYEWGRHLLRVCQNNGDHCVSRTVYLGWSGERSAQGDAATRLSLSADQERYQVGDTARIQVPVSGEGRLLVSLESGVQVLDHYWLETGDDEGMTTLEVPVTAEMAPNVYVHVALLQPHAGRDNDLPIRLYGIVPLLVDDPNTRLLPEIDVKDEVRPQSTLSVGVSERRGRAMTYTLAVVDEGLLGITGFATPRPHQAFYQREALGVLTWDLFDQVVGAYGGELDQLLALGGADVMPDGSEQQRRRFPPVVRFIGPLQLSKGDRRQHQIDLPAYMGEVRVMVVAGSDQAYGHAEESVTVTQPLTLLSSLPRVLSPGERLTLPVTLFAAEDQLGPVSVVAEAEGPVSLEPDQAQLTLQKSGEQLVELGLTSQATTGTATVTVSARASDHRGDGYQAAETLHVPVRAANPPSLRDSGKLLSAGDSWSQQHRAHGLPGTNQSWLTVSSLPAMGLERRLEYLLDYPHGGVEQLVSSALPQLYLSRLMDLDKSQHQTIQNNIEATIKQLRRFQFANGAFGRWPGAALSDGWGTSYAGHFLLEARSQGFRVPADILANWTGYQKRLAVSPGEQPWQWAGQAYRLYTLALAGNPEVGAQNRLREALSATDHSNEQGRQPGYYAARWLLAAAYQQMGLNQVAGELIAAAANEAPDYNQPGPTYGSALRDQAIALLVSDARGNHQDAWRQAKAVAGQLASQQWYSTQSTAWALMAMARFAGSEDVGQGYDFAWRRDQGDWQAIRSQAPVFRVPLSLEAEGAQLSVRNDSEQRLFASVTSRGTPAPGEEKAEARGLRLETEFFTLDGRPIDPSALSQGTDFRARVRVTNRSGQRLEQLALTQVIPSGWQIMESRIAGGSQEATVQYRDIRDDRVLRYLALDAGETREYSLSLNATFAGRFYLPGWQVEAMYQGAIQARNQGRWVEVKRD